MAYLIVENNYNNYSARLVHNNYSQVRFQQHES